MIDPSQFRELIVGPTLKSMDAWSLAAEDLLMGTAMQESGLRFLKQLAGGPALGVYQMEPATADDIWTNYLAHRKDLADKVSSFGMSRLIENQYAGNLYYATAMCRVHYMRVSEPLPDAGDAVGMGRYWKKHYNTVLGAGKAIEFVESFDKVVSHG